MGPVQPLRPATPRGQWKRYRVPYAFMAAAILLVVLVSFYPILYAVRLSLYQTEYLVLGRFVGLANFLRAALDPWTPARAWNPPPAGKTTARWRPFSGPPWIRGFTTAFASP